MDKQKAAVVLRLSLLILLWGAICFLLYYFLWKPDEPNHSKPSSKKQQTEQTISPVEQQQTQPSSEQESSDDPYVVPYSEADMQQAKQNAELYLRSTYEIEHNGPSGFIRDIQPYVTSSFSEQFSDLNRIGEPLSIQKLILLPGDESSTQMIQLECTVIFSDKQFINTDLTMLKENNQWLVHREEVYPQ
jgi:hypothetical protein